MGGNNRVFRFHSTFTTLEIKDYKRTRDVLVAWNGGLAIAGLSKMTASMERIERKISWVIRISVAWNVWTDVLTVRTTDICTNLLSSSYLDGEVDEHDRFNLSTETGH